MSTRWKHLWKYSSVYTAEKKLIHIFSASFVDSVWLFNSESPKSQTVLIRPQPAAAVVLIVFFAADDGL